MSNERINFRRAPLETMAATCALPRSSCFASPRLAVVMQYKKKFALNEIAAVPTDERADKEDLPRTAQRRISGAAIFFNRLLGVPRPLSHRRRRPLAQQQCSRALVFYYTRSPVDTSSPSKWFSFVVERMTILRHDNSNNNNNNNNAPLNSAPFDNDKKPL
jgi:hypothetical protein